MPRWFARALALGLAVTLLSCGRAPTQVEPSPAGPPRLIVMSSLIGYVEPCGCTLDLQLGGIDRAATRLAEEQAKGPTAVLVVGSTFFDEHAIPAHRLPQDEAKADLLAQTLKHLGVDAYVPGPGDLQRGPERLAALQQAAGLIDVTANAGHAGRVLSVGAVKVGVFGLADPELMKRAGLTPPTPEAARAEAVRLRAAGADVVVALGSTSRRTLRRLANKVEAVDLWVLGSHPAERDGASPAEHGYLIEAGDRGRNLGRVLLFDADQPGPLRDPVGDAHRAHTSVENQLKMKRRMSLMMPTPALKKSVAELEEKLAALDAAPPPKLAGKRFEFRLLPIEKADTPEPTVAGWLKRYNASLQALNLAAAGEVKPVPAGGKRYVGDEACADCHPEAVEVYAKTPHAKAWATLVDDGKQFDADCVGCHVAGWQQPGGTVLGKTKGLENVQCEACHGPGSLHAETTAEADIKRRVPAAVCETCHNQHHSPKFDYAGYLPKVLGPGHQALPARR